MLTAIITATALLLPTPPTSTDPVTTTLHTINAHRAKHGAPPLSLDSEVSRTAQEWADHLQTTNRFEHRPHNPYGENIYETGRNRSIDSAAADALKDWYRESHRYDYDREMTQSNVDLSVLHFTAMVWKSSDRLGVGLARGTNGTYVVLNFAERGNTLNRFRANVGAPVVIGVRVTG
ncbi:CAP family protein [Lentzea sp. NPDC058436]|uniref:CAP family protein n=1 Tax=Lentzea sp. NPDC058436 TaxID=3346499 RepID=UPI00364BBE38